MLKPVITILLYLFTPMLFGQSLINMKHYSVQDGLSQKNVHNFIQDDNGYICIIRKTKCFDFWERNVLFPKTKRSFFRTPTPPTLPFST